MKTHTHIQLQDQLMLDLLLLPPTVALISYLPHFEGWKGLGWVRLGLCCVLKLFHMQM